MSAFDVSGDGSRVLSNGYDEPLCQVCGGAGQWHSDGHPCWLGACPFVHTTCGYCGGVGRHRAVPQSWHRSDD